MQQDFAPSDSQQSPPTPSTDNSFLSAQIPSSPTVTSIDGETLRSRASSFNSNADTTRSRATSDVTTVQSRFEGDDLSTEEALRPDANKEEDYVTENNPFAFSPGQLNKLLNPKSLAAFKALGGLRGLERGLKTDVVAGLNVDEVSIAERISFEEATQFEKKVLEESSIIRSDGQATHQEIQGQFHDRKKIFKDNRVPVKEPLSIWMLFWNAYNDCILLILTAAAVISLALGIYESVGQKRKPGQPQSVDWVEGLAILIAIIVVVLVTGLNDYRREKQFAKLNKKKEDREVKAVRSGRSMMISIFDVMAGDVLHLESGDTIPADGIFVSGHGLRCDESSATGESDEMRKTPGTEVSTRITDGTATAKLDPFIISGSHVLEGVGTYLVTSVGVNSSHGKIMVSLQTETEDTPLQVKLAGMASWIGYLGSGAAGLLFVILVIRFLAGLAGNASSPAIKGSQFLDILIVAITIIVVAVPEGLPLAVTLALSFATKRMLTENNLVRRLQACEIMGNATTICSDKTGTLTQNEMTVVAASLSTSIVCAKDRSLKDGDKTVLRFPSAFETLSPAIKTLMLQSIALNSTAFEGEGNGNATFIGSKTETAMLSFAKERLGMGPVAEERAGADIVQLFPFDSRRKCMGVVFRLASGHYRFLVKGAAEILVAKASSEINVFSNTLEKQALSREARDRAFASITMFATNSLRTIAMLYKDFRQWPPVGTRTLEEDRRMTHFEDVFEDMTLIGIVAIQDPLREGVSDAVKRCQDAGVVVRMVTGDNVTTATAIAEQCGIKTKNGIIMEGPKFRQLSDAEMTETVPKLQVLARSSPEDKRILVTKLKLLGETVAVTGDGTNDGPALKAADVGFSMGIAGTEVAKEASDIILMDDNFSSIIKAIMWGRSVNDAVSKFLQFQITVNITAVVLAFVSAVSSPESHSVLSAVQLLWVNLIMDSFAALALATDAPTEKILDRKPTPRKAPLITTNMWKMITGQAIYQLIVTFVLYFAGASILNYSVQTNPDNIQKTQLDTIVFNTFVWMQIFNEFNNRRLDNKLNIFEGILKNYFFIGINAIMIGGQIMIIFVGGKAFSVTRIDGAQWAICILCALPCMLWAVVLRCIPDMYAAIVFTFLGRVYLAVYRPTVRVLRISFRPLAKGCNSIWVPIKRFSQRILRKKPASSERNIRDEEAPTEMVKPVTVPPITLTTPS